MYSNRTITELANAYAWNTGDVARVHGSAGAVAAEARKRSIAEIIEVMKKTAVFFPAAGPFLDMKARLTILKIAFAGEWPG